MPFFLGSGRDFPSLAQTRSAGFVVQTACQAAGGDSTGHNKMPRGPWWCVCDPAVHQPMPQLWHALSRGNSSSEESVFCTFSGSVVLSISWVFLELLAPAALGVPCILRVGHSGLCGPSSSTPCPCGTMQGHFGHLSVIWLFIPTSLASVRYF